MFINYPSSPTGCLDTLLLVQGINYFEHCYYYAYYLVHVWLFQIICAVFTRVGLRAQLLHLADIRVYCRTRLDLAATFPIFFFSPS